MDKHASNIHWLVTNESGTVHTWEQASVAVLMDIRRELQTLNRLLGCPRFVGIPDTLNGIRARLSKTTPKRRKR